MTAQNFVIDSSVIIKWLKKDNEEKTAQAQVYYERFKLKETGIIIPDIIFYELANFISRDNPENQKDWDELIAALYLPPVEIIPPDKKFVMDTVLLAREFKISSYDAAYLNAAKTRQAKLVTADEKLIRLAPELTLPL